MKYDLERIRVTNPLVDKLREYGVEVNSRGYANCPFHNEKTASFRVYSDGTYHCFGCGAHGDVIDFVSKFVGIGFNEACRTLGGVESFTAHRKVLDRKRKVAAKAKEYSVAFDRYYAALDAFEENESTVERLRPKSQEAVPSEEFLSALQRRAQLQYDLECAETDFDKVRKEKAK